MVTQKVLQKSVVIVENLLFLPKISGKNASVLSYEFFHSYVILQFFTESGSGSVEHVDSTERQDSTESTDITSALLNQPPMPQRPSIVMDSSQLPIQREVQKAESKDSLHMQSETMC